MEYLTPDLLLHILRNPWGHSEEVIRAVRQQAAETIEAQHSEIGTLQIKVREARADCTSAGASTDHYRTECERMRIEANNSAKNLADILARTAALHRQIRQDNIGMSSDEKRGHCFVCDSEWPLGGPEQHSPSVPDMELCMAAPLDK